MIRFRAALDFVYTQEGGKQGIVSTAKDDAGGATGWHGVTQTMWERAIALGVVPDKPLSQANEQDNENFYRECYWNAARCSEFMAPLDLVLFDAWVQHRPNVAARLLQEAASYKGAIGLEHDGVIGPATVRACQFNPQGIAREFIARRLDFYRFCPGVGHVRAQGNFAGWAHRLLALHELVMGSPS